MPAAELQTLDKELHQLTPNQHRFLECFAASSSVLKASRWAKVHRQSHYRWLGESETYRKAFEVTECRAARTLEDEAVRRAHDGVKKTIRYKGKVVGHEHEYSDSLMQTMLKATNPEKFRERQSVEHSGSIGITKRYIGVDVDAV